MINEKQESRSTLFVALKKNLAILLGLSAFGWLNALYALWHRQGLFANGLSEKSFCNVNSFIDCDSVAFSKFSSVFGVPTAAWGMMFYAVSIIFILAAYFSAQDQKKESLFSNIQFLFLFNSLNTIFTLVFAGISLFQLGTLCLICMITYLINLASLFFIFRARNLAFDDPKSNRIHAPVTGAFHGVVIGLTILVLALHFLAPTMVTNIVSKQKIDDATVNVVLQKFLTQTPVAFNLSNGPSTGPDNAPIVVVEFSDFQCPYCALSSKTMPSFLKGFGGLVKYVYKYYPLDSSCNPKMQQAAHPLACKAAKSAYCVYKNKGNDAFFTFKEETFAKQSEISPESLINTAKSLGLTEETLKACVEDPSTHQAIVDNVNEGVLGKVEGTPSIFVNGRLVDTGPNPQVLRKVFETVLESIK